MTRPDLAFPYSELRNFVRCPQPSHMALPPNTCSDTIALSTSEAEYMAASLCGQEIVYIRIYEDCQGQSCVHSYFRQRHIDIRRHRYPPDLFLGGSIKVVPLRELHMVADALTKSLPAPGLQCHRKKNVFRSRLY
jgi:hypothetical protein